MTPPARSSEDPDYEEATHQDGDGNPAPPGHRDAARSSEEPLTAESEKLLRDFDSGAVDHSELSARLWMIERTVRHAERAVRDRGADPKDLDEGRLVSRSLNRDRGADPLRKALDAITRINDRDFDAAQDIARTALRAALGEEPHGQ